MSNAPLPIQFRSDNIAVLSLTPNPNKPRGGVVVLDRWLIDALDHSLRTLDTQRVVGLILQSTSERVFVAGADLAEIDSLTDILLQEYLCAGSVAFGRITTLPFPSVAIIHKAALGGGLELAMHCDALVGARPAADEKSWKVGLPECGLGICPGWGGTMMLAARMDISNAIMATCSGVPFDATNIPAGLFAQQFSAGENAIDIAAKWIHANPKSKPRTTPASIADFQFHSAAKISLHALGAKIPSTAAAAAVIDAIHAGLQAGFQIGVAREQSHLIALRHTPEARSRLDAFLKR